MGRREVEDCASGFSSFGSWLVDFAQEIGGWDVHGIRIVRFVTVCGDDHFAGDVSFVCQNRIQLIHRKISPRRAFISCFAQKGTGDIVECALNMTGSALLYQTIR